MHNLEESVILDKIASSNTQDKMAYSEYLHMYDDPTAVPEIKFRNVFLKINTFFIGLLLKMYSKFV